MKRKIHLLDNQINVNLLTKIYFSVIFLLAIKLKSISNLHEHLSSLFWFVATEGVSVVSLMFLSCLRQVYEVYILKKVAKMLATFFLVSFVFSLFSEFLLEPLVECHVGTDFLLVLRLGKCQNIAR